MSPDLKQRLDSQDERLLRIENKQDAALELIRGDGTAEKPGFAGRMARVEHWQARWSRFIWLLIAGGIGAGFTVARMIR